jgi:hypothetical protein
LDIDGISSKHSNTSSWQKRQQRTSGSSGSIPRSASGARPSIMNMDWGRSQTAVATDTAPQSAAKGAPSPAHSAGTNAFGSSPAHTPTG